MTKSITIKLSKQQREKLKKLFNAGREYVKNSGDTYMIIGGIMGDEDFADCKVGLIPSASAHKINEITQCTSIEIPL